MSELPASEKIRSLYITGFLLKFATTFSLILSSASFLKTAGAGMLPVYYIALNILSITAGTSLAVKNIRGFKWPLYASLPIGLYLIWFSSAIEGAAAPSVMALYAVISIYDIYANILFWTHINQCLTIKEIKSYVGLISGVSFFGGILAGVFNKAVLAYISMKSAFVVCGAAHLLLPLAVFFHVDPPFAAGSFIRAGFAETAIGQIKGSRLLRIIMLIFVFSSFIRYTVGFQYGAAVAARFPDEKKLAGFIGLFDSAVKISIFFSQLIFAERLMKNFSFRANLFFYQAGVLAFSTALYLKNSFWLMIAFQFYFQLFVKLVEHNVAGALFNIFPRDIKNQIKFMVEGMVFPLASIFIGIFITSFKGLAAQGYFFIMLAASSALYFASTFRLNEAYMDSIAAVLRGSGGDRSRGAVFPVRPGPEFEEGFDMEFYLSSEREGRIDMIRELAKLPSGMTEYIILRLLRDEKDRFVAASLVKAACGHGSEKVRQQLGRTVFSLNDARVTANFIEAAAAEGNDSMVSYISAYMDHADNRVRANAVLAAVKLSADGEVIRRALASLAAMARSASPRDRSSAAAVMGELGLDCFVAAVEKLMKDDDPSVVKAALNACEKIGSRSFLSSLERLRSSPGFEKMAARAAARIENGVFSKLSAVMNSFGDGDKKRAAALVKNAPDAPAAEFMIKLLGVAPAQFSLELAEIFSRHSSERGAAELVSGYAVSGDFPAEALLRRVIFDGEKAEWANKMVAALASSNTPELEKALASVASDARLSSPENAGAAEACFEVLGRCIGDREKALAVLANARSEDPALADMALELLESVESEPLRKSFVELCAKINKNSNH